MAIVDKNIDKEPKWYVLHVFSGYENIAKQNLEITVDKYNLQDRIFDIVIPMEDELVEKLNSVLSDENKLTEIALKSYECGKKYHNKADYNKMLEKDLGIKP